MLVGSSQKHFFWTGYTGMSTYVNSIDNKGVVYSSRQPNYESITQRFQAILEPDFCAGESSTRTRLIINVKEQYATCNNQK